jgi:hypothetical protein
MINDVLLFPPRPLFQCFCEICLEHSFSTGNLINSPVKKISPPLPHPHFPPGWGGGVGGGGGRGGSASLIPFTGKQSHVSQLKGSRLYRLVIIENLHLSMRYQNPDIYVLYKLIM